MLETVFYDVFFWRFLTVYFDDKFGLFLEKGLAFGATVGGPRYTLTTSNTPGHLVNWYVEGVHLVAVADLAPCVLHATICIYHVFSDEISPPGKRGPVFQIYFWFQQGGGGWDADFVDPLPTDFTCCICFLAFREPMQLPCGHQFCKNCLYTCKETQVIFFLTMWRYKW